MPQSLRYILCWYTVIRSVKDVVTLSKGMDKPGREMRPAWGTWGGCCPWGLGSAPRPRSCQGSVASVPPPSPTPTWPPASRSRSGPAGTAAHCTACTFGPSSWRGSWRTRSPRSKGSPQRSGLEKDKIINRGKERDKKKIRSAIREK